jgi:hypothetical protein
MLSRNVKIWKIRINSFVERAPILLEFLKKLQSVQSAAAIITLLALILGSAPGIDIFAQSDDLTGVLEDALESLKTQGNNSSSSSPSVTPNADLWTRIQLEPHEYIETRYVIPPNSSFNFIPGSTLCPKSPCEQEFFNGVLRKESHAPNQYFFHGILKIIDKSAPSGPDIKNWLYYPFDAEFLIKSTKENIKTGNTVEIFVGDLGLDKDKLRTGFGETHDIQYSITGTFEQPSNILTLVGRLP